MCFALELWKWMGHCFYNFLEVFDFEVYYNSAHEGTNSAIKNCSDAVKTKPTYLLLCLDELPSDDYDVDSEENVASIIESGLNCSIKVALVYEKDWNTGGCEFDSNWVNMEYNRGSALLRYVKKTHTKVEKWELTQQMVQKYN